MMENKREVINLFINKCIKQDQNEDNILNIAYLIRANLPEFQEQSQGSIHAPSCSLSI